jgi:hypothetical protein
MRWIAASSIVAAAVLLGPMLSASPAHVALSPNPTPPVRTYTCPISPFSVVKTSLPPSGTSPSLVLSVAWVVSNDEDSGFSGYWGLDYFTTAVNVWLLSSGPHAGSYYATKTYQGEFVSIQGVPSPGAGTAQHASATGAFKGGYNATLTNVTFNSSGGPLRGSLGHKDYGGKASDVLLGTYGAGQVGDSSVFDWVHQYFIPLNGTSLSNDISLNNWGWIYTLSPVQTSGTTTNVWCNFAAGSVGDIST